MGNAVARVLGKQDVPEYGWNQIVVATFPSGETELLGSGDFGNVYLCVFPSTIQGVAAKVQHPENVHARDQRKAEVAALCKADHQNVIKLMGICKETLHNVIVYEYMIRGSLDHHLYGRKKPEKGFSPQLVLCWDYRMKIALGVAKALIYLHQTLKVIHGDVKESNILLDLTFIPKLSDFGFSTSVVEDENGLELPAMLPPAYIDENSGTVAPETKLYGSVTTKSDVYSYGVLLLTLFTGREAIDPERPLAKRNIIDWLEHVWEREECLPMVLDEDLSNRYSFEGLKFVFLAAKMCINPQANERPHMSVVEQMIRAAKACHLQRIRT